MKLTECDEQQRDALKSFYLQVMSSYKQEEVVFLQAVYRMLILANGSAIFLLSAYIGALVSGGSDAEGFGFPLLLFFVGLLGAGFLVQYSLGVMHAAVNKIYEQVLHIFKGEMDVEQFQGWGFSQKGLVIVGFAQLVSAACFIIGVLVTLARI